ncbi:DUF3899 domain-containing protein [Bacillus sp. B190/17]|uniref:DUF3899 domain-containing protein n=1 Tax=Bacillus lumedeiriae TaxID=3058829 RepID=A0ABW8I8L8_9BACI
MKTLQRSFVMIGSIFVISAVFALFSSPFWNCFVDYAFLTALFCTTAGACLFVWEGGFFNGMRSSFKTFHKSTKAERYIAEFDTLKDRKDFHKEDGKKMTCEWTYPFLAGGGFVILLTFVLALASLS